MPPGRSDGSQEQSLIPAERRARVAFAFLFFSASLCFLSYVSTL